LVLHLTKKELKRQRKLRRQVQQQEKQDLQAAGLLPAPEPRLTLRNFIQVLGDQAYLDPSQIEQKVQEQMLARQRAHIQRNEAAKLTKEQRSEKIARKLKEDTTLAVTTALFYVKDMSHPYHRAKVDLNAQQFNLSGCVVECTQDPSFACVIVEGGPKAIKRYTRLMLVRMKWTGPDNAYDDEDDTEMDMNDQNDIDIDNAAVSHKFNPNNSCQLIWQGLSVKRLFHGFIFQACATHDQGRKIFKVKGAAHYWDQVLQFATSLELDPSSSLHIKLLSDDEDNGDNDINQHVE
jgi:U4/U6 small nuclear ribonucleoprotein PRP3